MRVLLVGERFPDSFADNLAVALEDAGHAVTVVAPFRRPVAGGGWVRSRLKAELPSQPRLALRAQAHVLDAADQQRPELVLNIDFRLSWTIARELGRRDLARAFWFPDSMGNLGRETHVLGHYDAIFVKDSAVARHYRDVLGLNAHFLAEACNPRWHSPPDGVAPGDAGPSVVVAGNMYASRFALLRRLQAAGVQLSVHGPPWPRWLPPDPRLEAAYTGRYLVRDEKARAFRGAMTVLNAMASHEADGANCRLFEAAACGAVVLTDWRERLPSMFKLPEEMRAFASFDELVGELRAIAALTPAERRALGDAAAARAHAEHSYARRFETLTGLLGRG
jgi:hypothetical protein